MKKIAIVSLLAGITAFSFAPIATELVIGATMPKMDVKMRSTSGKEISLKDAAGTKGTLVMFSCNTCPYVVKNEDRAKAIMKYATSQNIGVIILNSNEAYRDKDDSFEAMKAFAQNQEYAWNYVIDKNHEIADAFGASRTPEIYLFDNNNKLIYHGAIDDSPANAAAVKREHLKEAINEMAAGKEISVKTSRSIGCGIKRLG
jgi:peroxiredoxin